MKNPSNITFRRADGENDAYYLQRVQHHWFGAKYESNKTLQRDLFDIANRTFDTPPKHNPINTIGIIAEHTINKNTVRIGGGVALLLDDNATRNKLPTGNYNANKLVSNPSIWLLFSVVDQAFRGQGIGQELFHRRIQWGEQTRADIALALGWERTHDSSRSLFERNEWQPVTTIQSPYKNGNRAACPDCKIWPNDDKNCNCNATIWMKEI